MGFDFEKLPGKLPVRAVMTAERLEVQRDLRMPYPTGCAGMC